MNECDQETEQRSGYGDMHVERCDWRTLSGKVFQFFGTEIRKSREVKEGCDVEVLIVEYRESA